MKFLVLALALVAVASALPANKPASDELHQIQQIIDAIASPSTDPATAIALQAMLQNLLGGIAVGPAIVQPEIVPVEPVPVIVLPKPPMPIAVGPAIVDGSEPIIGGPALVDVVDGTGAATPVVEPSATPLIQIILNINTESVAAPAPAPTPIPAPVEPAVPSPIEIGDIHLPMPVVDPIFPILNPMPVVDPIFPILNPMPVVDPIFPILNPMPVVNPIESVSVGALPVAPVVNLPEILN